MIFIDIERTAFLCYIVGNRRGCYLSGPQLSVNGNCQFPFTEPDLEVELDAHVSLQSGCRSTIASVNSLCHGFRGIASVSHGFRGKKIEPSGSDAGRLFFVGGTEMDLSTFWTSLLTSGAVATISGIVTKALVEGSIKHGFEQKIETLKSGLRNSEGELQAIRTSVLGRLSSRNQDLDRRRLQAAEKLWTQVNFCRRFSFSIMFMQVINIDAVDKAIEGRDGGGLSRMADDILKLTGFVDGAKDVIPDISTERLFVPPGSWLAYQCIQSMVVRSTATLMAIKAGIPPTDVMKNSNDVNEMVKAALPQMGAYLDKYPASGAYALISRLEDKIFSEIQAMLSPEGYDPAEIEMVARLVRNAHPENTSTLPVKIPKELESEPVPLPI